jgi:hypothetical protein
METKQTAVEFLQQTLWEQGEIDKFDWDKAKQMEKEQIMDSYEYGNCDWEFGIYIKGEQYYNETYNKTK